MTTVDRLVIRSGFLYPLDTVRSCEVTTTLFRVHFPYRSTWFRPGFIFLLPTLIKSPAFLWNIVSPLTASRCNDHEIFFCFSYPTSSRSRAKCLNKSARQPITSGNVSSLYLSRIFFPLYQSKSHFCLTHFFVKVYTWQQVIFLGPNSQKGSFFGRGKGYFYENQPSWRTSAKCFSYRL